MGAGFRITKNVSLTNRHVEFELILFFLFAEQMQQESQWLNFFREKELEKRFPCTNTSCSKTFKNEHARYTHVKYHCEKPQRYQCGHCGKKSHIKHNLMLHSYKKHKFSSADIRELYSYKAVKSNYF